MKNILKSLKIKQIKQNKQNKQKYKIKTEINFMKHQQYTRLNHKIISKKKIQKFK